MFKGLSTGAVYWMDIWTFFTLNCCKNYIVCLKRPKINKKRPGLAHLKTFFRVICGLGRYSTCLPTYLGTQTPVLLMDGWIGEKSEEPLQRHISLELPLVQYPMWQLMFFNEKKKRDGSNRAKDGSSERRALLQVKDSEGWMECLSLDCFFCFVLSGFKVVICKRDIQGWPRKRRRRNSIEMINTSVVWPWNWNSTLFIFLLLIENFKSSICWCKRIRPD